ncbi:sirohydrochlorin cobaltochelatase [Aedoeadaptatus pacaensis]|uniref:sirohydrochlorin cobaltochelatase n=1 Tax=Aedoeadaptatus pacaensis TaxID=1776390 RepID=UPI000838B8BC|nr:sirohydrochlorin cobaltochelatase [Peptoniphilus pacaensis]
MKALIIATFGSTHEDALRRDLDPVVEDLKVASEGSPTRVAFTSRMVINRYEKKTGIRYLNEVEAVDAFIDEGYKAEDIFVQPLHIIEGFEYEKLARLKSRGVKVGEALFHDEKDLKRFAEEAGRRFEAPTVFVGHGSHMAADKDYDELNRIFEEKNFPHRVCTIEGSVDDRVPLSFMKEMGYKDIQLAPLLLLAGDHAKNDIFGDEESVKKRYEEAGIKVTPVAGGMGSWDFVRAIYVEKLRRHLEEVCEN